MENFNLTSVNFLSSLLLFSILYSTLLIIFILSWMMKFFSPSIPNESNKRSSKFSEYSTSAFQFCLICLYLQLRTDILTQASNKLVYLIWQKNTDMIFTEITIIRIIKYFSISTFGIPTDIYTETLVIVGTNKFFCSTVTATACFFLPFEQFITSFCVRHWDQVYRIFY